MDVRSWSPVRPDGTGHELPVDGEIPFDPVMFPDPLAPTAAGGMFTVVPAMFGIILTVIIVLVIVKLVRAGQTAVSNASTPERTISAGVVAKRAETDGGLGDTPVQTRYYATFEGPDGERIELKVPRHDYGQLAEGDRGRLTHQGTWFRGFERTRVIPLDDTWEAPGGPSLPPPPAQR